MDIETRRLVAALRDYCQHTLDGRCDRDRNHADVLSAIVNTIDTAVEQGTKGELYATRLQADREKVILRMIMGHADYR